MPSPAALDAPLNSRPLVPLALAVRTRSPKPRPVESATPEHPHGLPIHHAAIQVDLPPGRKPSSWQSVTGSVAWRFEVIVIVCMLRSIPRFPLPNDQ